MRGVDATVKFATAAPDGVNRSSGSAVRFPMTVMMVSPATRSSCVGLSALRASAQCGRCAFLGQQSQVSLRKCPDAHRSSRDLVLVRPQHLLVQVELAIQLGHGGRLGLHVDDGVDALAVLGDLVGQSATAPDVDLVDGSATLADDVQERLQRRGYSPLVESWVEDDHD